MRLIDADHIKKFIEDGLNNPDQKKAFGHDAIEILAEIEYAPTIEADPVNSKPCGFCGKFNFGDARAEVYQNGANIVLASVYARFPVEEQFNFCPVCGRFVKK